MSTVQYISPRIVSKPFLPYLLKWYRYEVYYGGRGSGKTSFVTRKLVLRCRMKQYFKCIYVRKVYANIRESCYSAIKNTIRTLKMEHEFTFNESTMRITHKATGNCFIAKGMDDAEKVKSIDEPSHLWCEEASELTLEDFTTLDKSMRTRKATITAILTLNPVDTRNWVRSFFFSESDAHKANEGFGNELLIHRSTYLDNDYIDKQAYYKTLLRGANGDRNKIRVDVEGDWGSVENKSPWVHQFDYDKHVGMVEYNPSWEVFLSFDFNVDPITCSVFQHRGNIVRGLETIMLKDSNIYELCDHIAIKYPTHNLFVTGDATGHSRSAMVKDNMNYYTIIKSRLNLSSSQMKVPSVNPKVTDNRSLINAVFYHLDVKLDENKCKGLIFDLENAKVTIDGELDKGNRKDLTKRLDALDTWSYYCNSFFRHILKR